jgi:hypothetical protein
MVFEAIFEVGKRSARKASRESLWDARGSSTGELRSLFLFDEPLSNLDARLENRQNRRRRYASHL